MTSSAVPFSASYRARHAAVIRQFEAKPLEEVPGRVGSYLKPCKTDLYTVTRRDHLDPAVYVWPDVFSWMAAQAQEGTSADLPSKPFVAPVGPLSPEYAVDLLLDFLRGEYYGAAREALSAYAVQALAGVPPGSPFLSFYQGVVEILTLRQIFSRKRSRGCYFFQVRMDWGACLKKRAPTAFSKTFRSGFFCC